MKPPMAEMAAKITALAVIFPCSIGGTRAFCLICLSKEVVEWLADIAGVCEAGVEDAGLSVADFSVPAGAVFLLKKPMVFIKIVESIFTAAIVFRLNMDMYVGWRGEVRAK